MKFSKLFLLSIIFVAAIPSFAKAQVAAQACDTEVWKQHASSAWLSAQREIMQSQNIGAYKADSVLEYVCFDQLVGLNAWEGGNIFVHSDYFGSQIIPRGAPSGLDYVLTEVVTKSLKSYQNANFNHSFLGGRADALGVSPPNAVFEDASTQISSYVCTHMADVWKASKCMNFIDNSEFESTDGFYPFDVIKGYNGEDDIDGYAGGIQDVRMWPANLACNTTVSPTGTSITAPTAIFGPQGSWDTQVKLAGNVADELYLSKAPLGQVFKTVYEKTEPGNCAQAPILTGVTVIAGNGADTYPDGVCLNPGCSYHKSGACSNGGAGADVDGDGLPDVGG